jgi:hypothetical protein
MVAILTPDEVTAFFVWHNHSSRTMALGSTQACNKKAAEKADNLTAICEPVV